MLTLILLIIALYSLFAFLCYWHYNLVKSSEAKGDKENLCKIVRLVLICDIAYVTTLMIKSFKEIDLDIALLQLFYFYLPILSNNLLFFYLPILVFGGFILMILYEMFQIKKKRLILFLPLILIPVIGFCIWGLGFCTTLFGI